MNRLIDYSKEFPNNLKLAAPVIMGLLGHTIVQLIDNIMVGQLGATALAAVSLGNSFVFVAMSLGIGFSTAITPLIAQADGAGNKPRVQTLFTHAIVLCFALGVLLFLIVYASRGRLYEMQQPSEVVMLAFPYLKWVSASLIMIVLFQAFKQFADGLSITRPSMYATLFGNGVNVFLNYGLIFGNFGFPELGVEGAAIGTFVARGLMVLYLAMYIQLHPNFEGYSVKIQFNVLRSNVFKKILSLGLPSALQMFFEVVFFTIAIWLSGILGESAQAANQIALNLSSMTFMFAMGLGVVAMIRVGNQLGRKDYVSLKRIANSIFLLLFLFDLVFCIIFLVFHEHLPWIYLENKGDATPQTTLEVIAIASSLLIVSGFFQITDGLQAAVLGALRGMQDVNIPTVLIFIAYGIVGLPISYYLGLYTPWAATGIWIGLLVGLSTSAFLLFLRFKYKINKLLKG